MLTPEFIDLSAGLARTFTDRDLAVVAKPNTVLGHLNTILANRSFVDMAVAEPQDSADEAERKYSMAKSILLGSTSTNLDQLNAGEINEYSQALDTHIAECAKRLSALINVARNHVMPQVKELYEDVMDGLENNRLGEADKFEVKVIEVPAVFSHPAFVEGLSQYESVKTAHLPAGAYLPAIDDAELMDRVKTGIGPVDESLAQWLAIRPGQVRKVFDRVFLAAEHQNGVGYELSTEVGRLINVCDDRLLNATIIYLLSHSFFKDIPEGISAPPGQYREHLVRLREQSGVALYRALKLFETKSKEGALVERYARQTVHVFKDQYDEFLEAGGSNEALLGALFSTNRPYGKEALLANKDEFERVWQRQLAMTQMSDRSRTEEYRRRLAANVFKRQLFESSEAGQIDERTASEMAMRFTKTYNELGPDDTQDFLVGAIKLVCRTRYNDSEFEGILLKMHELSARHTELDQRDIATLTFIDYVGCWLASMLALKAA